MLSDLEADTAEYILSKFGFLLILLKENYHGLSVIGKFRTSTLDGAWSKYQQVVRDARIRIPGSFIGGSPMLMEDGSYTIIVEIY